MDVFWPKIPEGDPPEVRRSGEPHHTGLIVSQARAIYVASKLFPDDIADGHDCKKEYGREGQPCSVCAERNQRWADRVREVRLAIIGAFA